MKRFLTTIGLLTLLALPAASANAACCDSCNPCVSSPCACSCDPCGGACSIQSVVLPKKHFWNLKRTGYYTVCPCVTGGAAPVCPTAIGECCSSCCGPTKCVVIPKRHFWEKERVQNMPVSSCCDPCCTPCCDPCCK